MVCEIFAFWEPFSWWKNGTKVNFGANLIHWEELTWHWANMWRYISYQKIRHLGHFPSSHRKVYWRINISNKSPPFSNHKPLKGWSRTKDTSTSNRLSTRPIRPRETRPWDPCHLPSCEESILHSDHHQPWWKSKAFSARKFPHVWEQRTMFFFF